MNNQCELVQDLLPLYIDNICSETSRKIVDDHLSGCSECAAVLGALKKTEVIDELSTEKTDVIRQQSRFFKRKSALAGTIITGIFMIPILICLIVNLASGAGLSWFFIVLAALLLAASLIVVPLMVPKDKFLWTAGCSTASLFILLGVCAIYSRGSWFPIAAISVLFGLAVILGPFIVCSKKVRPHLGNQKGLICMGADTILFLLLLIVIGLYDRSAFYWAHLLPAIAVPVILYAWILFVLIRYPKVHGLTKAGFCCIATGGFAFVINTVIGLFLGYFQPLPAFSPTVWNYNTIDGNVIWLTLIGFAVIGIILTVVGIIVKGAKKK